MDKLDRMAPRNVYSEIRLGPKFIPGSDDIYTNRPTPLHFAALAQLVERSIRNRKVVGSTPMGGSIKINNLRKFILLTFEI